VTRRAPDGCHPSSAQPERLARPRPWGACYSSKNEDLDQDREQKLLRDPGSPPTKALNGAEPNLP
jgi:hypothetical protein